MRERRAQLAVVVTFWIVVTLGAILLGACAVANKAAEVQLRPVHVQIDGRTISCIVNGAEGGGLSCDWGSGTTS